MTEAGLKAVFLEERPMLLRLLTARLGSVDEAEDVLQDLWLRLETNATGPIAQPAAYLFRMANNLALDRRRSSTSRALREAEWSSTQPGDTEIPTLERSLIVRQRLEKVEAAIAALPDRTRMAFRLYRFEGLGRKQVANRMGISVSAVEKLIHRAYNAIMDLHRDEAVHNASSRRHEDEEDLRGGA